MQCATKSLACATESLACATKSLACASGSYCEPCTVVFRYAVLNRSQLSHSEGALKFQSERSVVCGRQLLLYWEMGQHQSCCLFPCLSVPHALRSRPTDSLHDGNAFTAYPIPADAQLNLQVAGDTQLLGVRLINMQGLGSYFPSGRAPSQP